MLVCIEDRFFNAENDIILPIASKLQLSFQSNIISKFKWNLLTLFVSHLTVQEVKSISCKWHYAVISDEHGGYAASDVES